MADKAKPATSEAPAEGSEWPRHVTLVKGCPLHDATPVDGVIYRRLDGTAEDWLSYREQGKTVPAAKLCQSTSLSCYKDLAALRAILAVHESWPSKKVVKADLRPEHGVIKQTNKDPNHYSLWLRRKYHEICATLFVPVDE